MKNIFIFTVFFLSILINSNNLFGSSKRTVRVINNRLFAHLHPLFNIFEEKYQIKVDTRYVEKNIMQRIESNPSEVDVLMVNDALLLEWAKQKNFLDTIDIKSLDNQLNKEFVDPDHKYLVTYYRTRVIYYAKDRVRANQLTSYNDLADPRWKGRVCIRSGFHRYNTNLFSQMLVLWGEKAFISFIKGLKNNLARKPQGNDRAQVKEIYEDKCDLALANSYYMGVMLDRPQQRSWALSSDIFFPDQSKKGAFIVSGGIALTKAGSNKKEAQQFLKFIFSKTAQDFLVKTLYMYPASPKVPWSDLTRTWGKAQGLKNGVFKYPATPYAQMVEARKKVIKILKKLKFDD